MDVVVVSSSSSSSNSSPSGSSSTVAGAASGEDGEAGVVAGAASSSEADRAWPRPAPLPSPPLRSCRCVPPPPALCSEHRVSTLGVLSISCTGAGGDNGIAKL
jgi:hypothetical protein